MDPIDITQNLSNVAPHAQISIWGLIAKADFIVKSVMFILLILSIASWGVIIGRFVFLKKMAMSLNSFEKKFWQGGSLENFYAQITRHNNHPASRLFVTLIEERDALQKELLPLNYIKDRLTSVIRTSISQESILLEGKIPFLATIGSAAPFIGLFGTVWGIMNSFTAIANSNNTSLTVVAPGIAEALFATALGLVAAIPAVMAYNKLNLMIDHYMGHLENFIEEVENIIVRHFIARSDS